MDFYHSHARDGMVSNVSDGRLVDNGYMSVTDMSFDGGLSQAATE
jgi:hypothetical protein